MRKGIILAGGSGSRLHPLTYPVCKQLLPVYDKPMIYYPMSTLMLAGIRELLIISSPKDLPHMTALFSDGAHFGMSIQYKEQAEPKGIAEAIPIGAEFIGDDSLALILGDNLFFGDGLAQRLQDQMESDQATVFAYGVSSPEAYGVVELDKNGQAISIEEKPSRPKSNLAITGLYFYPNDVIERARSLVPSQRGELEISDLNQQYHDDGKLSVEQLNRGYAWLDAGTESDLLEAANFVATLERRQGVRIGCIEEVAWRMGWINDDQLLELGNRMQSSPYGAYIRSLPGTK